MATKSEQYAIYKQEVAECHALLKRARRELKKAAAVIRTAPTFTKNAGLVSRIVGLVNDIPEAL